MTETPPAGTIWRHVAGKFEDYKYDIDAKLGAIVFARGKDGWRPTKVHWRYMEACVGDGTWKRLPQESHR